MSFFALSNPTFKQFVCASTILITKQLFSNFYCVYAKMKNNVCPVPEDAKLRGVEPPPTGFGTDHPAVKRAYAIVENDLENTPFFFAAATAYIGCGGKPTNLLVGYAIFRVLHTVSYINALQPWRFIFFLGGFGSLVGIVLKTSKLAWCPAAAKCCGGK